jgi:hypothetical protein
LEATLEQLSERKKASSSEIAAVLTVHPRYQDCRKTLLNEVSVATPSIAPIIVTQWTENDANIVLLVQRKITWGQYLQRLRDLFATQAQQITAEFERIGAGLLEAHEAELDRRRAALQALAAYAQQQQIIDNMRRPSTTNCTAWHNNINCVTTR